ncbi:hypothetical protein EHW65_07930 [Erwinia psidii]|uniref:hypothetical protein n=1 Tax=Erwinia psidii TaxID=69224 RepID=UPI00226BB4FF|nr:hypothetical protein [Erwinia psidii]MCX8957200.1 hypothetical protein [Erwinia psidii]
MYLSVTGCNYHNNGRERTYSFDNGASAQEFPDYPEKIRFRYYDPGGRAIYRGQTLAEMKAAIARHNKKWKLKSN